MKLATGNGTWNCSRVDDNSTNTIFVYEIGLTSQVVNGIISILTIFFNSILLVCMRTHRRKIPECVRHQLISLGTSDLISGISPGLWCLCLFPALNESARVCAAIHMVFNTSQYATLLNLCHLSARRWKVLRRSTQPLFRRKFRVPLVFVLTSLAWLTSLLLHLPSIAGLTKSVTVNGCVSPELFEKPEAFAYLTALYGITLLALDIFFLHSIIILKKTNLNVSPRPENPVNNTHISMRVLSSVGDVPQPGNSLEPEVQRPVGREMPPHTTVLVQDVPQPRISHARNFDQNGPSSTRSGISLAQMRERSRCVQQNTMSTLQYNWQKLQHKAFKQLLAALFIIHLATLPYLGIFIGFILGTVQFDPNFVFVVDMQVLCLNSLINPLIYGIYLKVVRNALKENIFKMTRLAAACFNQTLD